jgi:hypothetical protein
MPRVLRYAATTDIIFVKTLGAEVDPKQRTLN